MIENPKIEIISISGLAENEIKSLTQYLEKLKLPSNIEGELTLEFQIEKGRVKNIFVKEKESTITDYDIINWLKKSLLTWTLSNSINTNATLKLCFNN